MNSAQRVLANYISDSDGTAEVSYDRLLFRTAQAAMATSDDNVRPMTATVAYLESLLPGSIAIVRLRTRYNAILTQESQR